MTNFKYFERPDLFTGFIDEEIDCDFSNNSTSRKPQLPTGVLP